MDDVVWQVINQNFCSYKIKTNTQNFCRNEYNVTGMCNRQSCPLANSQYATIKEKNGILYLYIKTIERSHMPSKTWEKHKHIIDEKLLYWSNFLIYKNKARLTKLTQYLIKSKRLSLKKQTKLVGIKPKQTQREATREKKALQIAKLEKSIQKELLERLKNGIYGKKPLNVEPEVWKKVSESHKNQKKNESQSEYENSEEQIEFLSDTSEESDLEEWSEKYKFKKNSIINKSDVSSNHESESDIDRRDINEQEIENIFQKKRKHGNKKLESKKSKSYIELEYEQENQLVDEKT
ncbi:ribosome biosynthesis protein MAK16 [Pneumocystis jirovecii RU7]|uniref:Protein MAK16 n=1 Tax=Pneumocystis jirovecii (strain RU7) TaxID=1408657 RepID=A0A0W4ZDP0_PNEJ7|nr:ribosome biosynthesis protein MAK16 [Pneumocystis jirovecii RU7]KTW26507.1 hypothetical protein T551_03424 [Pneumocystis jirovecii RU7]